MEIDATAKRALRRHSLPYLAGWVVQRVLRRLTARGRRLPDFVIIGAQRCGTTSLYNYIADHPGVASAFMKETHFFDLHFSKGMGWYRAHFPLASERPRQVAGEATPYYLFYPHAWRRFSAALPEAKVIVLLRNPVDRAYSHYHHEVSMGVETRTFEGALEREQTILPGEVAKISADEGYRSYAHFHYSYAARGVYIEQLEPWLTCFPDERLLVIRSEDLYADPAPVVMQVFRFLGLPAWASGSYRTYNLARDADMNPATREHLAAFYRPYNQRLCEALGRDFGWDG